MAIPQNSDGNKNKSKTGTCLLCGKEDMLSFEHVPPQCAFNNKPILVQGHEHLVDKSSFVYGKKKRSQRGFGKQALCISCNNNTGNWYAKDFCSFTEQAWQVLKANKNPQYIEGEYLIRPQNVIKQILMMFVATDSNGAVGAILGVKEYLLDRENVDFPAKIKIYLYSNASPTKRMLGYCVVSDFDTGKINKWAEINYHPFGYFFTYDSPPPNELMVNITDFSKVPYDKDFKIQLTTAYLQVKNIWIGTYSNL